MDCKLSENRLILTRIQGNENQNHELFHPSCGNIWQNWGSTRKGFPNLKLAYAVNRLIN